MMSECVEFYHSQASKAFSSYPWLLTRQQQALQQLAQKGFPTRHDEDWKYTSVESFLQQRFVADIPDASPKATSVPEVPIACHRLMILDGQLMTQQQIPSGVIVLPLMDAFATMPEKITPYLDHILTSEHAFHALNTAMLKNGLFIYIPEGVCLDEPLWISHWQSAAHQAVHLRHLVVVEKGSHANVIEDYFGEAAQCYFTNTVTEVHLAEKSSLTHTKIQRESKRAYHVGHLAVKQAAHSQLDSHVFSLGGQWVRSDLTIHLEDVHASCGMNGMYLPFDGQHMDLHTLVRHQAPDCQSTQDYKGIISGHARAVFNGRVVVVKDAQHTNAKQQNKNLLLSTNAEVDTKPQLEIFADDVTCTHGATVGQLDEEALFYLATRGIGHEEACRYLMQAFMTDNLRAIPDTKLAAWIGELFNEQIG